MRVNYIARRVLCGRHDAPRVFPFPGNPAGFSCVRWRKLPFIPAASVMLDSPNLSRRRSAAESALQQTHLIGFGGE